jgi:hypothetical protein
MEGGINGSRVVWISGRRNGGLDGWAKEGKRG